MFILLRLTPEERFDNHKAGIKDASLVRRYGIRLLPERLIPVRSTDRSIVAKGSDGPHLSAN